ncbi:hypothetical protein WAI453_012744 [Rhynchosporium graminicola]
MDISKLLNAREQSPVDISEHPASTEGLASQPASSSDTPGTTNEDFQNLPVAGAEQQDHPWVTKGGSGHNHGRCHPPTTFCPSRLDQSEPRNYKYGSRKYVRRGHHASMSSPCGPNVHWPGKKRSEYLPRADSFKVNEHLHSQYRHRSSHHARTNTQQCHGDPKSSAPKPSARPSNREGQTSNPAPEVSRSGSNDPTSTKKTGKIQTEQSDSSSKSKKTRPRWVEDPNSERGKRLLGVPPFMLNNNIDAANMVESDPRTGRPRRNIRGGPSGPTASEQLTVPPVQPPPENDNVNGEAGDDDVGKESGDIDQNKRIDGDDVSEIPK